MRMKLLYLKPLRGEGICSGWDVDKGRKLLLTSSLLPLDQMVY